jgi:hypothetical protein
MRLEAGGARTQRRLLTGSQRGRSRSRSAVVRSSLSCGSAKGEEPRSAHVLHGLEKET